MKGGRGGGRGHGNGRGKAGRGNQEKPSAKKTEYKFYIGSAKQSSDYEKTHEYVVNEIRGLDNGADISKAVKTLEPIDFTALAPKVRVSTEADAEARKKEQERFEWMYQDDYKDHKKRIAKYVDNLTKAYAIIWKCCSEGLKQKLQQRKDFIKTIEDNPIELLKAIKEHAISYQENKYPMVIINEALKNMLDCKQKENENLIDYARRFKATRDVLESQIGGPVALPKYMEEEHEDEAVAFERYMAYLLLANSDKSKYGSILDGLNNQYSLGNKQYPETVVESINVLSNHKFDAKPRDNKKNQDKKQNEKDKNEDEETLKLSFAQMEGKCYCCGKPGHKSPKCKLKDSKPKEEWAINKAKANEEQSHANVKQDSDANKTQENSSAWTGAHIEQALQMFQANETKDWILLDTGSTTTLFCNPNLVTNIRQVKERLDVSTNGGVMTTNLKADLPDWGEVWYSPHAIINIFNFGEMERRYPITYDSKKSTFTIQVKDKKVNFVNEGNDLYLFKPNIKRKGSEFQFLNSVEENKEFYSHRQFEKAKRARDLYHAIGTPSIADFRAITRMNSIRNNPVTLEDIQLAEQIFGPDIGSLKGKGTRKKPKPIVSDYVAVPTALYQKQHRVTLCIDTLKINGLFFLATISINIKYRTVQWVASKTTEAYRSALKDVFRCYNAASFRIVEIRCDNEYRGIMDEIEDEFNIRMNYASAKEHVPEAERNNRVLKERYRAIYHRLPYQRLSRLMVKHLAYAVARYLNYFPSKTGISQQYSPRMILHQEVLDYEKQCSIAFGTYVQASTEENDKNANHPRTLDCIYLRPTSNHQGGHELMDLRTGKAITRQYVTPVPIRPQVVNTVHNLADKENMPTGLKIETKTGDILYDAAWIAGVDYVEEDEDDDDEDESYVDDENEDEEYLDEDDYYDEPVEDEVDPDEIADLIGVPYEAEEAVEDEAEDNEEEEVAVDEFNPTSDEDENYEGNDNNAEELPEMQQEENQAEAEDVHEDRAGEENVRHTRSGRISRPPVKYSLHQSHFVTQGHEVTEYSASMAKVIAMIMCVIESKFEHAIIEEKQFAQTFSLKKGLKEFGNKGRGAAYDEMKQIHDRTVFWPLRVEELTPLEKQRAMESLMFLAEKRDGSVKARTCANGSTQRPYTPKEETASPTVGVESILITGTIEAKQGRDVMTSDIPNAFVQTAAKEKNGVRIIMKIRGVLVDILIEIDPGRYKPFVVYERGEKVLYVRMLKALYGMLESSLLYYKKFTKDIESIGFNLNPYDPCVANRIVNGKQHTITWHVDDLKSSHVDPKVNDEFLEWLQKMYGSVKKVEGVRGKVHNYLAMTLDYSEPGVLKVDMTDYVKGMIRDFPEKVGEGVKCPWTEKFFRVDETAPKLSVKKKEIFHTFVMKAMFVCKRARQDIQPAIAFLSTRVKEPNESDWMKLIRVMRYLKATQDDVLRLEADDTQSIKWHVDAAFAVHKDMKSHTGATMTLGKGTVISVSTKQKVNARSSTEAELVSVDDVISKVIWAKLVIEAQGYQVKTNIMYRDNQSSMKMEENGKESTGKRTRHFNIKYFYITDLIKRGEVKIVFCPTNDMIADYMTKPLVGTKFFKFRKKIMNNEGDSQERGQQECVG